ncbi:MAG TPA: DUF5996 family protein [Pyrinomonadaceae bacterium]|jgi:hypothetical protein
MTDAKVESGAGVTQTWPSLPLEEWQETKDTLHMWTQVVGKIRLAQTPLVNHWWNVPLYVTARGLGTTAMPYEERAFEIEFDFIDHLLHIKCSDGSQTSLALAPRAVADFYREVMSALASVGIRVKIWTMPVEVENPIRFEEDRRHASYTAEYANRFWRILVQAEKVLNRFRSRFIGKASPVHFFWGSFDLAATRFSGRRAPERVGADSITREAYSHEAISHGFWPGGGPVKGAAFYSYTAPEPAGLKEARIAPESAFYSQELSEFLLMYDDVRTAASPEGALMQFLESTYEAGANLAQWDRASLERTPPARE